MPALIFVQECHSTNYEILNFLDGSMNDIKAVYTCSQTRGKGQYGNSWACVSDLNLAFSLALPAPGFAAQDHLFNFRTALLLADFIANMTKNPVEIKWPNDIVYQTR